MSDRLSTFTADLRYPFGSKEVSGDKWSQWSSLPMIELSALETYRFVKAMIARPAQRYIQAAGFRYVGSV